MGGRAWSILIAIALARVAFGYQYQTVASLAPDLIAAYRLDYTALGSLIGVFVAPGIALALPLGLLGRRYGDGLIVGTGLTLMTLGPAVSALYGGPSGIAVGRVIAGCGAVGMIVLQSKIIADWFTGRWFMVGISVSVAAYPIGVSVAQITLPPVAARGGLTAGLLSACVIAGITTVLFLASYRPAPHAAPAPRRFSLPSRHECVLVTVAGLIWTAYTGSFAGFVSYVPSLLAARGQPEWLAATVIAVVTWGSVGATLAGGGLAARFGGFATLALGTAVATTACFGIALTDWPLLCAALFGVFGSLPASTVMAAGTLSARPENRAVGMGLFYTIYYLGNALAPALCGRAADLTGGPAGALYAAGVIGLLAIPMWLLHARLRAAPERRSRRQFADPHAPRLD